MVVSSAFFARSAQSAQNAAAERGVANATGVRCFKLPQATPKSVFAMPRAGKVREVICASAPHQGHEHSDTPSGVGMVSGAGLFLMAASFFSNGCPLHSRCNTQRHLQNKTLSAVHALQRFRRRGRPCKCSFLGVSSESPVCIV